MNDLGWGRSFRVIAAAVLVGLLAAGCGRDDGAGVRDEPRPSAPATDPS